MSEIGHYADRAIDELKRIANAFEEQNKYNLEWIELQKKWHDEAEALTEKRYQEQRKRDQEWHDEAERLNELRYQGRLDLDRQIYLYERECHDEAERLNEERYQEHSKREQALMSAYVESLIRKKDE